MAEPARYLVPAGEARSEFIVKRSRFVGSVGGASDPEEALAFVERVAGEFRDASHNAWAYRLRIGFQVDSRSDDAGEPGGAKRPLIDALKLANGAQWQWDARVKLGYIWLQQGDEDSGIGMLQTVHASDQAPEQIRAEAADLLTWWGVEVD